MAEKTTPVLTAIIVKRTAKAADIVSLEIEPAPGDTLPPFEADSHIDVFVAAGIVRQYSLCNNPTEKNRYRIAILRALNSRGGSDEIHRAYAELKTIQISASRNNFRYRKGQQSRS
jgi:vanillate O-demethylase ferredoxin subunit